MPDAKDLIQNLSPATWGSLDPVPTSILATTFEHRLVTREYYGVDGEGHDNTGRRSLKFRARLFFVETIKAGLYTTVWPQWRERILRGDRDDFAHPELGVIKARVDSGSWEISSRSSRGVVVEVGWTESIEVDDEEQQQQQQTTTSNNEMKTTASEADEGMNETGNDYPSGFDSGEASGDFSTAT